MRDLIRKLALDERQAVMWATAGRTDTLEVLTCEEAAAFVRRMEQWVIDGEVTW